MGNKINLDENLVIKEYLSGKSSLVLSVDLGVSKPKILSILKKYKTLDLDIHLILAGRNINDIPHCFNIED
jgi:hypothetical protein